MTEPELFCAIDPGTAESAWVNYDVRGIVAHYGYGPNEKILQSLRDGNPMAAKTLLIEGIASQGMAVGAETFTTCRWIGRFQEAWERNDGQCQLVYRQDVKIHLCGHAKAKDPNIRQALIDKFGGDSRAIGGVKCETCKGKGTRGYTQVDCGACCGTGTVMGARMALKNCPRCKGKCFVRGEKATCLDCRGTKWKHPPGPLFGIASHCWSALAVAVTFTEKRELAKAV